METGQAETKQIQCKPGNMLGIYDIFSLEKVEKLYGELLEKGASFHRMKELNGLKNGIILRHDFDTEMDSALPFARMEHGLNIKSSYYFLLTARSYNLYSEHCRNILREVISLGHEIGLHFDASIYPNDRLEEAFLEEKGLLEVITMQEMYSMSLHDPAQDGTYPYFNNIVNAYNWNIFSSKNYFSDSGFSFKATADQIITEAEHDIVQMLLHPTIYCIRNEEEPPSVIYLYKTEIERFADALFEPVRQHPYFVGEFRNYPESHLNIKIKIRD